MIYRRKNSKYWYAAFYVKNPEGQFIKRAFSTRQENRQKALDTERDLKKAVHELKEQKRLEAFLLGTVATMTAKSMNNPGMKLESVWDHYSRHPSQRNRTERTQASKRIVWNRFLAWLKTDFPQVQTLNDISRDIADAYLKTLEGKRAATFNNEKNSLSSIWQVLTVEAGLRENIWRLFSGADSDSVRYRDFSLEEVRAILANSNDLWRTLTATAFYAGLRFKDCCFLRKSQIKGEYIILTPAKTRRKGKDVQIFIHADLRNILDFCASTTPDSEDSLFPEAARRHGNDAEFQREFGRILEKAKITADGRGLVGFHSLRHSFVALMEKPGASRQILQGIVGHGSPTMTAHYSHDTEASRIIEKMPSLLETKTQIGGNNR